MGGYAPAPKSKSAYLNLKPSVRNAQPNTYSTAGVHLAEPITLWGNMAPIGTYAVRPGL